MDNSQYAVFPVQVAKDLLRVYRQLLASGLLGRDVVEDVLKRIPRLTETPVFFRNDSGYECPPYACMQVIGTVENGGQNYCMIDKPADVDASAGEYIFNGHHAVPSGEFGTSQSGRLVRGIKASGTSVAGEKWAPVIDAWTIEKVTSGPFVMAGDDDIATDVARVFLSGGAGANGLIEYKITSLRTASSAIAAEAPYTDLWIATVSIKGSQDSSLIGTSVEVVDHSGCIFEAGFANYTGWAFWGVYGSLEAGVPCDTMTPFHWAAINRCCDASTGTYAMPC